MMHDVESKLCSACRECGGRQRVASMSGKTYTMDPSLPANTSTFELFFGRNPERL